MNVIIFGASGGIGRYAVKHAVEKGYSVTAYIRPSSTAKFDDRVNVVEGEISDYEAVLSAVCGNDAVIWCVGIPMKRKYVNMASLEGHRVLLEAMKEAGVSRLIDWGTPSVPFEKDKKSFITVFPSIAAAVALTQAKKEMVAIGDLLKASDLDWTLVRFMAPKNSEYTGKVKVGFGEKMNLNISREDIGAFMVEQIDNNEYVKSMPIIGS